MTSRVETTRVETVLVEATQHGPVRTCIGCRARREQSLLTRFVPDEQGRPVNSRTAPGRGAWVCTGSASCREAADKKRAFDRAWKTRTTMKSRTTMAH